MSGTEPILEQFQPKLKVLSLGAGVQSTTLLLMSCKGELPKLDAAIFTDTGWEPRPVYKHLDWLEGVAAEHGIPVHRVSTSNIREDALMSKVRGVVKDRSRWVSMPFHTRGPNGRKGMIRRQCTKEYKLQPIRRKLREVAGFGPREKIPPAYVQQWLGISLDEARRMRFSDVRWVLLHYPLIDRKMTRGSCFEWLRKHGFPEPPRSACVGCPFRHNREWRWLRDHSPEDWADAVAFDRAIRKCGGMRGDVFLHRDCVPLDEVDLSTPEDRGQMSLDGMCPTCFT